MEKGLIESNEPMNFLKEVRMINQPRKELGEFKLAQPSSGRRTHVDVRLCRDCRKIMIEYEALSQGFHA